MIDSCRETTRSQFGCKCEICFVRFPRNIRMDRRHILASKKRKRKRNKMVRNSFEHLRQSFVSINRCGEATTIVTVRFSAHFLGYQLREQKFSNWSSAKIRSNLFRFLFLSFFFFNKSFTWSSYTITYYLTVYQWIDKFRVVDCRLVLLEQFRNIVQFHISLVLNDSQLICTL